MRPPNPRNTAVIAASLLALCVTATIGLATVPLGQQDTISDGVGRRSSVAISSSDGRAMVAFDRGNNANNTQTFGRAIDRAGNPVGPVFPITDAKSQGRGTTQSPAIAYNGFRDEYFVVWAEDILAGDDRQTEIFGRRLAPDGTRIGAPVQLSGTGPDDDRTFAGGSPEIVYNGTLDEYLVVWIGSADRQGFGATEREVFGRRVSGVGAAIGTDGFRISAMGPAKSEDYAPRSHAVTYNPDDDEYLVVWEGDTQSASIPPLVDNEFEIFGQRLTAGGTEVGGNDFRISDAGPPSDINFRAQQPDVSYSPVSDQYLVAWDAKEPFNGATDRQIYAQRLSRTGAETGENDFLVSEAARDGVGEPVGKEPEVIASNRSDEFFIVWTDGSNSAQLFGERRDGNGALVGPSDLSLATKAPDDTSSPSDVAYSPLDNRYMATWTYADMDQIKSDVIDRRLVVGAEAVLPVPPPTPLGGPRPAVFCGGRTATIIGTGANDVLRGTVRSDVIVAGRGNDTVIGGRGNDIICLGPGNDRALSGGGSDRVFGQNGRDRLFGGNGADRLIGGAGVDNLIGQRGRDRLFGGPGNDRINGGNQRDIIRGGTGNDRARGGAGNDDIRGQAGRDRLLGQRGNDRLLGGPDRDIAGGGPGRDRCVAEVQISC